MNFKIKEVKEFNCDELRVLCMQHNWYTCGTNGDYEKLFKFITKKQPTKNTLFQIAENIYQHTSILHKDVNAIDEILNMMFLINKHCVYSFFEIV